MNDTTQTALLILNPNSRLGDNPDIEQGISLLQQEGIRVDRHVSTSAEQSMRLIEDCQSEVDIVIIGGGDGTISSVAKSLYQYQLPLAVLPLGTANDFARSLGIPIGLPEAFQTIVENQRARINLSKVNDHYFLNVAHIGLGVQVTQELTQEVKRKWGVLSYLAALISAFKSNRSFRLIIDVDDVRYKMRSIHLAVGNGRYYGGGNIIDDQSTLFDGRLSLYSLKPQSFLKLLSLAPFLRKGQQRLSERTFCATGTRIHVQTKSPHDIHADGEPVTKTPATFEVIPDALEVIIGHADVQ